MGIVSLGHFFGKVTWQQGQEDDGNVLGILLRGLVPGREE